jgi:hypothetical protein
MKTRFFLHVNLKKKKKIKVKVTIWRNFTPVVCSISYLSAIKRKKKTNVHFFPLVSFSLTPWILLRIPNPHPQSY